MHIAFSTTDTDKMKPKKAPTLTNAAPNKAQYGQWSIHHRHASKYDRFHIVIRLQHNPSIYLLHPAHSRQLQ